VPPTGDRRSRKGLGMWVTDEHLVALRSYLSDAPDVWLPIHRRLLESGGADGYELLASAAFVTAVRSHFSPVWTRADVIRFVADMRSGLGEEASRVNARVAEALICRALGDTSGGSELLEETDQEARSRAQLLLLIALVEDADLDEVGIEEFIRTAATHAADWQTQAAGHDQLP
jgi:hypothetical protein